MSASVINEKTPFTIEVNRCSKMDSPGIVVVLATLSLWNTITTGDIKVYKTNASRLSRLHSALFYIFEDLGKEFNRKAESVLE